MTWYLTLRANSRYSCFTQTDSLLEFLAQMPELQQTGLIEFQSKENYPGVIIIMAYCDENGGYAIQDKSTYWAKVNVVELICSSYENWQWYEALASRIAKFLGWSAFEDIEERQVWPNIAFNPDGFAAG